MDPSIGHVFPRRDLHFEVDLRVTAAAAAAAATGYASALHVHCCFRRSFCSLLNIYLMNVKMCTAVSSYR